MTDAVYPGRFDPITLGHVDIVQRAARLFDHLSVAVFETPAQPPLFSAEERTALAREALQGISNVAVEGFRGLVVEYAQATGAKAIVRGLRASTEFQVEFEMALMNRRLAPEIDVVCLLTSQQYLFVRSSIVREVARLGGNVVGLVPPNVIAALKRKYGAPA